MCKFLFFIHYLPQDLWAQIRQDAQGIQRAQFLCQRSILHPGWHQSGLCFLRRVYQGKAHLNKMEKKKSRDETQTKRASLLLIGVGREDMRLPDVLSPSRIKHPTRAPSWGQCSRSGPKKSGRGACVQQVINSVCHEPEGPGLFARLFSQSLVSLFFLLRASHHQIWEKIYMK